MSLEHPMVVAEDLVALVALERQKVEQTATSEGTVLAELRELHRVVFQWGRYR